MARGRASWTVVAMAVVSFRARAAVVARGGMIRHGGRLPAPVSSWLSACEDVGDDPTRGIVAASAAKGRRRPILVASRGPAPSYWHAGRVRKMDRSLLRARF